MLAELIGHNVEVYCSALSIFALPVDGVVEAQSAEWLTLRRGKKTELLRVDKIIRIRVLS